ncbi:7172_t:CDS:2 [Funneliformis geosporum]|nr:7172_t:CDS:2 [Funneliformis geosporum]
MYLTLLVVIDNNTKSCLVAQYLSEDETIKSYEWFLGCIFQVTNSILPVYLFSDADPTLINAIVSKMSTGIQSTQRVEVINCLIKEATSNTTLLYNLHDQAQKILDNEAKVRDSDQIIKDTNQYDNDDEFLEDQMDKPQTSQTSLFFILEEVQLSGIVEIWKLFGLTKSYKHYVILLIDKTIYTLV